MTIESIITSDDHYLNSCIIFLFSYFSSTYIFASLRNVKWSCKSKIIVSLIGVIISSASAFVKGFSGSLSQLTFYCLVILVLTMVDKDKELKTAFGAFLSVGFAHVIKAISLISVGTILWALNCILKNIIVYLLIGVIQLLLSVAFMKIKRFKNGFQFFLKDDHLGVGICVSGVVFMISCVDGVKIQDADVMFVVVIFGILVSGFGLYLWIQRSITARYREHLQSQSEEHFKEQLEERDKEIEKHRQSNEYLAKIVHRDNHLMNSLNTAIDAYYNTNDNAERSNLFREIQTMIKERGELIDREQRETKLLPSTGSLLIDSTINDLFIKAAAHGIDFDMAASAPVSEIIGKYISQTDLQTLLSDHIKDAVIAVEARGDGSGKILLDLSMQNDNYCITIYDNGVAFEPDTLSKLGMERVTTHAESGGSGIGFMTTFETLKKAYASLILTEFDSTMPFTKSVAFRFDGESSFIIQSHRSEELKEKLTRDDVVIL